MLQLDINVKSNSKCQSASRCLFHVERQRDCAPLFVPAESKILCSALATLLIVSLLDMFSHDTAVYSAQYTIYIH